MPNIGRGCRKVGSAGSCFVDECFMQLGSLRDYLVMGAGSFKGAEQGVAVEN